MNQKSFTLIELLVTISIIGLLTVMLVPNLSQGNEQLALRRSAHKLAQEIRGLQEMAMSAREVIGPSGERVIPAGGYGIRVFVNAATPNLYDIVLFADCNNNGRYTPGLGVCGGSGFEEKISGVELEPGIRVKEVTPNLGGAGNELLEITFKPPDPLIEIWNSSADTAAVILSPVDNNTKEILVIINIAGLVWIFP